MVADADRGALVGLIQQGVDLGFFQIPDQRFCRLLERDRTDLGAP